MRIFVWLLFSIFFGLSCKKAADAEIHGTVISQSGASSEYYLVEIDNPDSRIYPFICDANTPPPPVVGQHNCRNSVFITNLPAALKVIGTKIVFSRYKNLGPNPIFSSTYVPRDIEVYNANK